MRVFRVDLSTTSLTKDYIMDNLPKNCLFETSKYKNTKSQYESLVAWYVLSQALLEYYNYDISQVQIKRNSYNKPYVDGIHFNISHSGNLVYVCISLGECGIDVQQIKDNNLLKHKEKVLNFDELTMLSLLTDIKLKKEYITKVFCKKEAYFKLVGTGLNKENFVDYVAFDTIDFIVSDSLNNSYALSIAQHGIDIKDVTIMEVNI